MSEVVKYTMHFTSKDGSAAQVFGDERALEAIERAFERAGIQFNESVQCWDEGYYKEVDVLFG